MAPAVGPKTGGLHPKQTFISGNYGHHEALCATRSGHFCLPRQSSIGKIHFKTPPLASHRGRCPQVPPKHFSAVLCQPTLEGNRQMVKPFKRKQTLNLPDHNPILVSSSWWPLLVKMKRRDCPALLIPTSKGCSAIVGENQCLYLVGP
jgi:hypothetical protein